MEQAVKLAVMISFGVACCMYLITHSSPTVHIYQDPNTGCHYLYTAGSSLVPREDGTGEHMGCFGRGGDRL